MTTPAKRGKKAAIQRKVYSRAKRATDLETHVCLVTLGDERLIDIRDYIPSSKRYGRGTTFSVVHFNTVWDGLSALEGDLVTDD